MLSKDQINDLLHYDSETGVFVWNRAPGRNFRLVGRAAGRIGSAGYVEIGLGGKRYMAHRLAWLLVYGQWPKRQIDHINRIKTDNRISNLREATVPQNGHNVGVQSRNTSGVRGVDWRPGRSRWRARLMVESTGVSLGNFSDFFEAVCARKSAERLYYGEFAP